MALQRGYSSGKFGLELEGKTAGFVKSVEGGEPHGLLDTQPPGTDGIAKKQIRHVDFEPITIQFGVGMSKDMYDWMSEVLDRRQKPRSGAIVFLNYDFTERERLEWRNGLITEIVFPSLDGRSKDAAFFTVTIAPELTTTKASNGKALAGFATKALKKWLLSNFTISVSGLESASSKVMSVQGLSVTQPVIADDKGVRRSDTLQVSNVVLTVPFASAQPWLDWATDFLVNGNSDDASERTATIQYRDQAMKDPLFTVTLSHVGPLRARHQVASGNIDAIALVDVELYCESVEFAQDVASTGSAVGANSTPQSRTPTPGVSTARDTMLALLAAAGGRIDTQAALRVLQVGSLTSSPELVAARLKTTTDAAPFAVTQRTRADGESLGAQWASEHASLDELQTIAPLETGDWSAIQLPDEHTLVAQLREAGIVPPGGEGAMQLVRDEFVEGIVAGAARVLRSAQPHLDGV